MSGDSLLHHIDVVDTAGERLRDVAAFPRRFDRFKIDACVSAQFLNDALADYRQRLACKLWINSGDIGRCAAAKSFELGLARGT